MIDMSEEEYAEIMRKANESMLEHDREQRRRQDEALAYVATIVGHRKLEHIKEYIEDCEYTSEFEVTESHEGVKEDCDGYAFRYVYLDQYCNGGWAGDEYAGWVWVPLPKGKFLKFHYSM
jgi:hypothetical protein